MSTACSKCKVNVSLKSPGVQCCFCADFFHAKCISLSKEQLAVFAEVTGAVYKCENCRRQNFGYTALVETIKQLEATVKLLNQEIQNLKTQKGSEETEIIINEISDRQRREKNLILFNVPELLTGSVANKQAADLNKVVGIINNISPEVNTHSINVVRLGRSDGRKPRPLKVEVDSRDSVFAILKNKRKLSEEYAEVSITTDRTALQREQLKKVIHDINERKEQGEEDLYIKYINGNPVIAKSKK